MVLPFALLAERRSRRAIDATPDHAIICGFGRGGAIIVGVRDAAGQFEPQPPAERVPAPGDVLLAMGAKRRMERVEGPLAAGSRARAGA